MRYQFKTKPYPHQVVALKLLLKDPTTILNLDPGMGKTKISIDYAGTSFLKFGTTRVLIVVPSFLIDKWVDEIIKHLPTNIPRSIYIIRNKKVKKEVTLDALLNDKRTNRLKILLISYDTIKLKDYLPKVLKWKPEMVLCDEAHMIGDYGSKRNISICKTRDMAWTKVAISATSMTKDPLSTFSIYRLIDDTVFGYNVTPFKDRYAIYGGFNGTQIVAWKSKDELKEKIGTHLITMKKEDWLKGLPEKTWDIVPVELSPKAVIHYNKLIKDMITVLDTGETVISVNAGVNAMKLQQITSGYVTTDEGESIVIDNTKLDTCMGLVDSLVKSENQVVIVSRFVLDMIRLQGALQRMKIPYGIIYGDIPDKDRYQYNQKFQNKQLPVMLLQSESGQGIDLYSACHMIFYALPSSLKDWLQVQDRIHRIGSTSERVFYHLLFARHGNKQTVDYKIYNRFIRGEEFVNEFLDYSKVDYQNYLKLMEV